jgi:hypothetical protein
MCEEKAKQADTSLEALEAAADELAELQAQAEAKEELNSQGREEHLWEDS